MKKFLVILLMFAMIFTFAACGGSDAPDAGQDGAQDEVQNEDVQAGGDEQQNEGTGLDALTETDKMKVLIDGEELQSGTPISYEGVQCKFCEVQYDGQAVTDYELYVDGGSSISATVWDAATFRLDSVKNGSCELVVVRGSEKAVFPVAVEGMPEVLALNWIGYMVYSQDVFGTPGLDDDIAVLFNGEPISDYEFTVADESLAEVTKNADGSLHIKALKEGEAEEFLTITYAGADWVFGLCV